MAKAAASKAKRVQRVAAMRVVKKQDALVKPSAAAARRRAPVPASAGKIRIGVIHGKTFDPIKVGTQDRNYPEHLKIKNNTGPQASGWGGQFQSDVSAGLKLARLQPDVFEIDFMKMEDITAKRLARNHLTFDFWGDYCIAVGDGKRALARRLTAVQKDCHNTRFYPEWDYFEWITHKSHYMKALQKAGIPIIPTVFLDGGFESRSVMKKIVAQGWDKFLVKVGYCSYFGMGVLHGKTQELVDDIEPMRKYEKDNKSHQEFLIQPYVLKPNGDVFDEIRNFFIEGEWAYSVYTDGTDENGVYAQPEGALKEACKALAQRAYQQVLKVNKWAGKPIETMMTRVDIGLVPDKTLKLGHKIFVNEIEMEAATWLGRYAPFDLTERMGHAMLNQTRKVLKRLVASGKKLPNHSNTLRLLAILDERLGLVA